jgi:hypothetical protein
MCERVAGLNRNAKTRRDPALETGFPAPDLFVLTIVVITIIVPAQWLGWSPGN